MRGEKIGRAVIGESSAGDFGIAAIAGRPEGARDDGAREIGGTV